MTILLRTGSVFLVYSIIFFFRIIFFPFLSISRSRRRLLFDACNNLLRLTLLTAKRVSVVSISFSSKIRSKRQKGDERNSDSQAKCAQIYGLVTQMLRDQFWEAAFEMKYTYFEAPQPPHRHLPTSSNRFTPGGACPFTSLQLLQIKAKRALGSVSSSPSSTSMILSYHREPSLA